MSVFGIEITISMVQSIVICFVALMFMLSMRYLSIAVSALDRRLKRIEKLSAPGGRNTHNL